MQQNAAYTRAFLLVSSTDHLAGLTGAAPAVTISKAGAAFAAAAGAVAELANGWYRVAFTAADTNTLGDLACHATAAGADPSDWADQVVAYNPNDAAALGLSRLDAAVSSRATPAQILATPANVLATDATGRVTVGSNADKTGYALTAAEHTAVAADTQTGLTAQGYTAARAGYLDTLNGLVAAIWAAASRTLTAIGNVTVGGYAGGQDPATLVWGAATRTLTALGAVTVGGYAAGQDPGALVLDVAAAGHNTANTIGARVNSAGSAGDPWSTALPGTYAAGSAGALVGNNLASAAPTANANADALLDRANALEVGVTPRGGLRLMLAALAGVLSGAGTTTVTINNAVANAKPRITATVDANGNRTAIVTDQT
jgi:hypothetical protein